VRIDSPSLLLAELDGNIDELLVSGELGSSEAKESARDSSKEHGLRCGRSKSRQRRGLVVWSTYMREGLVVASWGL
jgi:hypothetical protein